MTDEMYARLRQPRQRKNYRIPMALCLCFVIVASVVGLILYAAWYQYHYRAFVSALSRSTVYAYQNDSLWLEAGDRSQAITNSAVYLPYNTLIQQPGKLYRAAPERAPDMRLDYGDGAVLLLWAVELEEGARRETGVFWQFTAADGECWLYDTDLFSMEAFRSLLYSPDYWAGLPSGPALVPESQPDHPIFSPSL